MNKHYALVRMSKNLLIATFSHNGNQEKVGFLSIPSFVTMAAPDKIQVPTRTGFSEKAMSDIWLASSQRRVY